MTFSRALLTGLLLVGVVCLAVVLGGCSSELPPEVARASACRTYERNYRVMDSFDKRQTMGVYLDGQIRECQREGYL